MEDAKTNFFVIGDTNNRIRSEQMDDESSIDFFNHPQEGNILRIGGSIYFLKYWTNEQIEKAYEVIQKALSAEMKSRGYQVDELVE